jgi:acyl-CoA reductase-like NAD-dependent aldehyde dehydrogenase
MDNLKEKPKFKKVIKIFLLILLSCIVLVGLFLTWQAYDQWRGQKRVQELAEAMQKAQDEWHQMQVADTYGGKTPQETLNMYIEAVEKGDYDLASKYFVIEKQEEWKGELIEIDQLGKVMTFLNPIKEALENKGEYSENKKEFSIYDPVGVDFMIYPNGIWKITGI